MADERIDSMGVPITGSQRDENLDALERRVRNQFEKPVQDAEEFIKFKILEALKDVESLDAPTKAIVAGLAVSREAKGNELFNRAVEQLNLPVEVQQIGNDFAAGKQFQGVLGENSNLGVSAYRPESGDATLAAQVSKQYPGAFGRDSTLGFTGSVSTQGDPRFAVDARKEFRNPLGPNSDASIGAGYDSEAGPRFEARIQQTFSEGGRVNMNKPRVTQGLTNLLNKYSTGPLAGAGNVSRGTPVQPFNQGGAAQTYEEALKDPNRMNLAKRLGPEAWASSGIGNTPSQPLVNSLEYRNYGSNKNVPQGDFNPIVTRTFTPEELSQRAADRGYGSVENLSNAEKAGLQLDQSPYFDSYEAKSQMMNSPQGDQRYTNYDPGDYARGSGPKIMIDPVSSIPVTSIDYNLPGSGTSTGSGTISTGPVSTTPAYEDAPVAQTDNFEDNPVLSVPVVAPVAPTPVAPVPVPPTPVAPTPVAPTPVAAAQPIVNPVTYPTAAVDPVVAPIDDTPLPPSVYNPPAPPEEAVYTPPAATVVDTPETLFTPPEVFDVPEAKEYQYLQDLRPNFDISDVIKTQTSGYTPTQGMVINPTEYQYSPDQVMSDNVYVPQIYRPMPQFTLSDLDATEGTTSGDSTDETDTEDTAGTADTTQGTSFASLDSLSSNQQAYNPEQDYADRYGYTLAELREINAERLRMGLPRLQDLQTDIGDINFSGGM